MGLQVYLNLALMVIEMKIAKMKYHEIPFSNLVTQYAINGHSSKVCSCCLRSVSNKQV